MEKYKFWDGRKVTNGKEIFIETDDANWSCRLSVWKKLCYTDPLCPCPMPKGHIMFKPHGYKPVDY